MSKMDRIATNVLYGLILAVTFILVVGTSGLSTMDVWNDVPAKAEPVLVQIPEFVDIIEYNADQRELAMSVDTPEFDSFRQFGWQSTTFRDICHIWTDLYYNRVTGEVEERNPTFTWYKMPIISTEEL